MKLFSEDTKAMKHLFQLLFVTVLAVRASAQVEPVLAEHPATTIAKTYMEKLKSNQVRDAILEYWDFDSLLSGSFGLMYHQLPPADQAATQRAFANFLAAPFANPQMIRFFSTITIRDVKTVAFSDSLIAVTLNLTGNQGQFNAINTLLFSKSGSSWRIVDQRQGAAPSIRCSLVIMWVEEGRGKSSIASVLDKATAQTLRQAEEQPK